MSIEVANETGADVDVLRIERVARYKDASRVTSLDPREIVRCLRLKVWDVEQQRMVGMDRAMRQPAPIG